MSIIEYTPAPAPAVAPPDPFLALLDRVIAQPELPIERIEQIIAIRDKEMANRARLEFEAARPQMQADFPIIQKRGVIKDKSGRTQSRYATWDDIAEGIQQVLARHRFSLSFQVSTGERISVRAILAHASGHRETSGEIVLPADTTGSKNTVQAIASAISYAKRYAATNLLNIVVGGEDDDGAAAGTDRISDEDFIALRNMMEEVNADEEKFCQFLGVQHLEELPKTKLNGAIAALAAKRKQMGVAK